MTLRLSRVRHRVVFAGAARIDKRRRHGAWRVQNRLGASLVEVAVVLPVLFLLIMGLFEFGRAVMAQQILTNASREGARRAILEQSTSTDVETQIADFLASSTVTPATVTVTPSDLNKVGFGDPVTVTCSVPFNQVSWLPTPWFLDGATLSASCVMVGERPE